MLSIVAFVMSNVAGMTACLYMVITRFNICTNSCTMYSIMAMDLVAAYVSGNCHYQRHTT